MLFYFYRGFSPEVANDFRNLRICETWMLSDYGLLVVLAVEDESCGLGG